MMISAEVSGRNVPWRVQQVPGAMHGRSECKSETSALKGVTAFSPSTGATSRLVTSCYNYYNVPVKLKVAGMTAG